MAADDLEAIKAMGPSVMPRLARMYDASDQPRRQALAYVFYHLGWKSDEAKDALMGDVHTPNQALRLQVQWALGRVSDDVAVVDVLLENMQNDAQPLFRDKAACALANDQIHLAPAQKVRLFEGLHPRPRRSRSPTCGGSRSRPCRSRPGRPRALRFGRLAGRARPAVEAWRRWLAEYRSQL